MELLFVSDLHISGPDDPLYGSLLNLICERAKKDDVVILAGDVFDLFVGNKVVFCNRYRKLLDSMSEAADRGVSVHYIEGNHDFLIHRSVGKLRGVKLHSEHIALEFGGKKLFVAHGDTVDRSDHAYLAMRAFFRSPLMSLLVFVFPGKWLDLLGQFFSKRSSMKNSGLPSRRPTDSLERLRKIYRSFAAEKMTQGFDYVVLGHCHDLDEMSFSIGGRLGQYINIGYPRAHGSFLSWAVGEEKIHREKLPGRTEVPA